MHKRSLFLLGLLIATVLPARLSAQIPNKTPLVTYSYSQFGTTKQLFVRDSVPTPCTPLPVVKQTIAKAQLKGKLDFGDDYNLGTNTVNAAVTVTMKGYSTFVGTSTLVFTRTQNLSVSNTSPEQLFVDEFTVDYNTVDRIDITLSSTSASPTAAQNLVRLQVFYEEQFYTDVSSPPASPLVNVTAVPTPCSQNPVTFNWTTHCIAAPDYEFQLLRLYNTDTTLTADEQYVKAVVDWNQALTIITDNSQQLLKLTLSEGQGYYVWRVRPIGNLYEDGLTDPRNWGQWSSAPAQGATLNLTAANAANNSATPYLFFYNQFNDTINWIFSRVFVEGDETTNAQVNIGEQMTFADGLQMVRQNQAKSNSTQNVMAGQTLVDYSGRAAMTTLPAPLGHDYLGYEYSLVRDNTNALYNAADFDTDVTMMAPSPIGTNSKVTQYYSDQNTADVYVPGSTDGSGNSYAFARTIYFRDGNNRPKEQSMPGTTHTLGSGKTTRASYSGVADIELVRMFGDEAPAANSVHKTVSTDQNNTSSISYISKEGATIATCLSVNPNNTLLDHLESMPSTGFTVRDTLKDDLPAGTTGLTANKQVTFTEPTTVTMYYDITPAFVGDACVPLCRTCDYEVKFSIFDLNNLAAPVFIDSMTVSPDTVCSSSMETHTFSPSSSVNLPAGDYIIQRHVEAYQVNPATGNTYLDDADSLLNARLEQRFMTGTGTICGTTTVIELDSLVALLERGSLDSAYQYLGVTTSDTARCIVVGCDTLNLPILHCYKYDCSDNTPDFEAYLTARWSSVYGTSIGSYLPGYSSGQFNTMINNMLTDGSATYDCQALWTCWDACVQGYDFLKSMSASGGTPFSLLDQFLSCAGYQTRGFTTTAHGSPGYLSHAYAFFNYTLGTNTACESAFCCPNVPGGCTCTTTDTAAFTATQWRDFRSCIENYDPSAPPSGDPVILAQAAEDTCRSLCESRLDAFINELVEEYHAANIAVEGYVFPDTSVTPIRTISADTLYCQAWKLVDLCKSNCELTIYYNGVNPAIIDSIGSTAQHTAMEQAMTWNFEIDLNLDGGGCPSGFSSTGTSTVNRIDQLIAYLNNQLEEHRDTSDTRGHYWNYVSDALAFEPDVDKLSCYSSMAARPYVYVHPKMESSFIKGYDLQPTDSISNTYMRLEHIYPLQADPDSNLAVTVRITLKSALASTDTIAFTDSTFSNFSYVMGDTAAKFGGPLSAGTVLTKTYVLNTAATASGLINMVKSKATRNGSSILLDTIKTRATNCPWLYYIFDTDREPIVSATPSISIGTGGLYYNQAVSTTVSARLSADVANATTSWFTTSSFEVVETTPNSYKMISLVDTLMTPGSGITSSSTIYHYTEPTWAYLLCNSPCLGQQSCPSVCMKWVPLQFPDSVKLDLVSCEEQTCDYILTVFNNQVAQAIQGHRSEWEQEYRDQCVNSATLLDHFSFEYALKYYHYTLYYHDRAGNLVKTVPPKGTDLTSTNRMQHPNHHYESEYRYRSLANIEKQRTPDGGITDFWYNNKTQIRASQNARQVSAGHYGYIKYDALGRTVEGGEFTPAGGIDVLQLNTLSYPSTGTEHQRVYTVYTTPATDVAYFGNQPQRYLQNRVSYSYTDEDGSAVTTSDRTYTYYSYDPHGNVEWMIQEQPVLGKSYLAYEYDFVSGSVLKVRYNEMLDDRFFHRYVYDSDKRLVKAETSVDNVTWETDANYQYYLHGPLKRSVIGEDKVQGLDYVYTLQGWLKGINHSSLLASNDPGHDRDVSGTNQTVGLDVWGMMLGYYTDDYKRSGSVFNADAGNTWHLAGDPLYNGNITSWTSNIGKTVGAPNVYEQLTGHRYRYDDLNRIKLADFRYYSGGTWNNTNDFDETFAYDANGNFTTLNRNGHTVGGSLLAMDNFTYNYADPVNSGYNNRLTHVDDLAGNTPNYTIDIDDEAANNYAYDATGNLVSDVAGGISSITWNPAGKVEQVTKTNGTVIKFHYNSFGQRIRKEVQTNLADPATLTTTYYVLDASGNTMSVYERTNALVSGSTYQATVKMTEQPIYGSSRLGQRRESNMVIHQVNYIAPGEPVTFDPSDFHLSARLTQSVPVNYSIWFFPAGGLQELQTPSVGSFGFPSSGVAPAVAGKNSCSITDDCGNTIFKVHTLKQYHFTPNVCLVFNRFGQLVQNIAGIQSGYETQTAMMPVPGADQQYYLFTISASGTPYYHIIDAGANKVISKNNVLDYSGGYGQNMTLIEDRVGTSASRLYMRRYSGGTCYVQSFTITSSGISASAPLASFTSGDLKGEGEMQVSADGLKFVIANNKGVKNAVTQTFSLGSEIRLYTLSADHGTLSSPVVYATVNHRAIESDMFTASGANIYFTERSSSGTPFLKRYTISGGSVIAVSGVTNNGDIRRGYGGRIYTPHVWSTQAEEIDNVDTGAPFNTTLPSASGGKFTGGMPMQNHTIFENLYCDAGLFTRTLDHKRYELNDHLGNVRVVVSDIKQSVINGTTNLPEQYTAVTEAYYNYYAYGSEQANRTFDSPDYRYGYNGMEKDNEIKGNGNSYTSLFRQLDPRLGRWASLDPVKEHNVSGYVSMGNSPILFVDPNGDKIRGLNRLKRKDENKYKQIMSELSEITGLTLKKNFFGVMKYEDPEAGKDESDRKGSAAARNFLMTAIDDKRVIKLDFSSEQPTSFQGLSQPTGLLEGTIYINQMEIHIITSQITNDLNPKTMGFGMALLHELGHWYNNTVDLSPMENGRISALASSDPGPQVTFDNLIRKQLDDKSPKSSRKWGRRMSYYIEWNGVKFVPFSWETRTALMEGDADYLSDVNASFIWMVTGPNIDGQRDYNPSYSPPQILPVHGQYIRFNTFQNTNR